MTASVYRHLVELHRLQAERLGPRVALRSKRHGLYRDLTWEHYREQSLACAAALVDVGVAPGERVGLLAENRVEWLVADMGLLTAGAVNVPPHAPLTARQIHFQLHDAEVVWLFVSNSAQLEKIRSVRAELPHLKGVVVFDSSAAAEDAFSWRAFLQRGRRVLSTHAQELARREAALEGQSLATIMYTSGTTGNPKGVMLSHDNLLSNAVATSEVADAGPEDVLLSWLPYSHIYARTVDHYMAQTTGLTLCLGEGQETLILNLAEIQPTRLTSVPRFYEKIYAAVADVDPEVTRRRLRGIFGGRIRVLSSGGAPLPPAIAEAYLSAGLLLLQGYGLTESSPVISFNRPSAYRLSSVGQAVPGVEIRIAEDGEVLTRGPHVMLGYWKSPSATAASIRDGWLHTGDLGTLDAEGYLTITGRKKDLMVLSNGKKVVPTQVEGLLIADPCFDQVVVHGEGRNFLTALVVPKWDQVRKEIQKFGVSGNASVEELVTDPKVISFMENRAQAALADLAPWERVRRIVLLAQPFSVASEELTVSLKLRRGVIFEHNRSALERLYEKDDSAK